MPVTGTLDPDASVIVNITTAVNCGISILFGTIQRMQQHSVISSISSQTQLLRQYMAQDTASAEPGPSLKSDQMIFIIIDPFILIFLFYCSPVPVL